jgi:intein/homing endonuclease
LFLAVNPQYRSRKIKVLELSKTTGIAKSKIKFVDNKILIKIEKIESSLYSGYVYNFECGTHTFMCRNILTHNCDPLIISGV